MRQITCQCCASSGHKYHASWLVNDRLMICDTCRLAVIDYWRYVLGFTLAPHPFIDEFMQVESRTSMKNPLDI